MVKRAKQFSRQQLWIISLLVVVTFVVFILPNMVSEPWLKEESAQPTAPVTTDTLPPSEIAEKTLYRQQSQSLLASILVLRDKLLSQSIEQWAKAQFDNALILIEEGDNHYSYGKYKQSLDSYDRSLKQLQQLEQLATDTLERTLTEIKVAIERADLMDIPKVREAVSLVQAIAPEDSRVQRLEKRALNFSGLAEALSRGDSYFNKQQYQQAKNQYQTALTLIADHQRAKNSLDKAQTAIDKNDFIALMSDGYTALDKDNFALALEKFTQAKAIFSNTNPENTESALALESLKSVEQAIAQLDNRRAQNYVTQQIKAAANHEQQEHWQQAVKLYQQLLDTDSSLVDVKARLVRVAIRAELDRQIVSVLNDPLELADENIFLGAQKILLDAKGINNPGPKLKEQIDQLTAVIDRSRIPLELTLLSDNKTEVTIYRVAKLGAFQEMSVQLLPGRYIIAGSRKGYRDVRIEVVVQGTEKIQPLTVSCTESI